MIGLPWGVHFEEPRRSPQHIEVLPAKQSLKHLIRMPSNLVGLIFVTLLEFTNWFISLCIYVFMSVYIYVCIYLCIYVLLPPKLFGIVGFAIQESGIFTYGKSPEVP